MDRKVDVFMGVYYQQAPRLITWMSCSVGNYRKFLDQLLMFLWDTSASQTETGNIPVPQQTSLENS